MTSYRSTKYEREPHWALVALTEIVRQLNPRLLDHRLLAEEVQHRLLLSTSRSEERRSA